MPHAETPNQVVAIDFVQVELKRESRDGTVEEVVRNVLTVVDLATDFCQQIVVPREKHAFSKAFHQVWGRPYGVPKTVFMDPDHRAMSSEWQRYLVRNNIQLLYAAAESHWQLGKVEVVNRILRGMAQRREPRHAGSLADVDEQRNIVSQSQVLADPTFSAKLHLREIAAKAFLEEHARDTWRRAVGGLRPIAEDEVQFRALSKALEQGDMPDDVERADEQLREKSEGGPRKIRRRFYRSQAYWEARAAGMPPHGALHEGETPNVVHDLGQAEPNSVLMQPDQNMSLEPDDTSQQESVEPPNSDQSMPDFNAPVEVPVPPDDELQVTSNRRKPKETKHLILSLCAAKRWKLWGADIKTAFLSGDPSQRDIFFRPPKEIKEWMNLSNDDLFRLEKAAYGLAEAPRAWFLRLSRELKSAGLLVSQLDPCLYSLRSKNGKLLGICGVHVDDLIGGGEKEMDDALSNLRKQLPFGDFRTFTIRYTGIEIRQCPNTFAIELGQEAYIDALEPVETKPLGSANTPLKDASIMRTCAGQLAWVANSTRPDQAFLASFLQGIQDKGTVAHVQLYNKAIREMKQRKVCLRFPSGIDVKDWRLMCISDAGWGTRANGESQGGFILCITTPTIFERRRTVCWIIDWQSKKLRRVVRSSVAAETLAGQNGLDSIEAFQAMLAEVLDGLTPRQFREIVPTNPAALVIDSKGFFDAITRSCCSQAVSVEKRLQIDYAIAKETTVNQNIIVFWVNNLRMSSDCLTKLKGDTKPLYEILDEGTYEITLCTQSGKKEKQGVEPKPED
ncbi:unnamed protein product [Cladocopium goreaui]|uniref:Retrovirus-related Pol polyprotein from transposon RE1 (Retro element 1) (AtRE1) n=1 Tax=Cladocopium goreaui TaxID=2562237 RepID=A0A9P1FYN6_9DINO|nr:unnamed protein product [Cladocopium goreaui]